MSESLHIDSSFRGWGDGQGLLQRAARTSYRSGGDGGVAARGRGTLRREREFGDKVGPALARDWKRHTEAARRKRFSAGQVRAADFGGDCRTTRPDFGRDRCGAAQAADSYQPQLALAFSRSTRHYPQKKRCKPLNGSARTSPAHADVGFESKGCLIPPGWYFSTRLQSAPTWCASGAELRGASD
jgi:hypothetical protein